MAGSLISLSLGVFGAGAAHKTIHQPLTIATLGQWVSKLPHTPVYQESTLRSDLGAVAHLNQSRTVSVVVANSSLVSSLASYSNAVSTPGNPLFHHFLTPSQMRVRFGPSQSLIDNVTRSLETSGWTVTGHNGFIITAKIPVSAVHNGFPISSDIWGISGLSPIKISDSSHFAPSLKIAAKTDHVTPTTTSQTKNASNAVNVFDFQQAPVINLPFYAPNGDQVDILSWNPNIMTSLPAGLPFNLILAATASDGQSLPITQITNIGDSSSSYIEYWPSGTGFPDSNNALWQLELASVQSDPNSDTLSFTVTLSNGQQIPVSLSLPPFTGNTNVLDPLTGVQLTKVLGSSGVIQSSSATSRPGVAIMDIGQLPSIADLQTLMNLQGLPMPTVQYNLLDGATTAMTNSIMAVESNLDLQAVASVDPGGNIVEYSYPYTEYNDPLESMLNLLSQQSTAKVATISYQFWGEDPQTLTPLVDACVTEGITILMGSGDFGAWDGSPNTDLLGVSTGDSQPGITTIGGLDLASPATYNSNGNMTSASGPAIAKSWGGDYLNGLPLSIAQAYLAPNRASSGGYSTTPVPSWQSGFVPPNASGMGVPDISSLAGIPGLLGVYQGEDVGYGGTSLSTPLTAGWLADLEGTPQMVSQSAPGLGNISPLLFNTARLHPDAFSQALWGANGYYTVTSSQPGTWNPVTGLGQPHWDELANLWSTQAIASFNISGIGPTVEAGQPITVTVTADNGEGNPVTNFNGTASIYTTDSAAQFPTQVSFQNGISQFQITFSSPGSQTVTVSDPSQDPPVTATSPAFEVDSPLHISFSTTAPIVGSIVTASAEAPLANPEYQFWVYDPATNIWTSSGTFSNHNSYQIRESVPGTYQWIVYAKSVGASRWSYYSKSSVTYQAAPGQPMVSALSVTTPSIQESPGSSATFTATASDMGGTPLYQFWVHGPNNRWILAQNYSTNSTFTLSNLAAGSYTIAVYALDAQDVAKGLWQDTYYFDTVINVGSSVSLSAPTLATAGSAITVTGTAQGITDPVYQFWIETPGGVWIQRGFGTDTYTWTPTDPGTYTVAVYAKDPNALALPAYTVMADQTIQVN